MNNPRRVYPIKPETKVLDFASEVILKRGKVGSEEAVIITPSGQWWNSLSPSRQEEWRETLIELGADPEDYLAHMKEMLPQSPKGAK